MTYIVTNRRSEFEKIGNYEYLTIEKAVEHLMKANIVAFDSETTGFGFSDCDITALIFNSDQRVGILVDVAPGTEYEVQVTDFKEILETKYLVIQRSIFDLPFLYKHGIVPDKFFDTYLAEYSLSRGIDIWSRDYGSLVEMYTGTIIDKSRQKEIHKVGILDPISVEYCFHDVEYLIPIMEAQKIALNRWDLINDHTLNCRFSRVLAYIEYCGIGFDEERWMRVCRHTEYEEYGAWLRLNAYIAENTSVSPEEINWDSPAQVKDLFRDVLGINVFDKKTKKETINEKFLEKQTHEILPLYFDYKHKNKQVTTYGRNWFDFPREDGRIHTQFNPMVATGRTSCGNVRKGPFPNLQNIKRGTKELDMRTAFVAKGPNVFVNVDYSSQEGVIMADKSKEPGLLDFYRNGDGNFHSFIAKQLWPDVLGNLTHDEIGEQYPELRNRAKAAGFAIQYGGNGATIADNLNIAVEEGERVYEGFMKAFPKLSNYFDAVHKEALDKGYILSNNITKGKRFIKDYKYYKLGKYSNRDMTSFENKVYRLALNTPVQGTAADISKTAGVLIFEWILKNKRFGKTKIVNFIHDEFVLEEHQRKAEETAQTIKELMEQAASYYLTELTMRADPKISKKWEH